MQDMLKRLFRRFKCSEKAWALKKACKKMNAMVKQPTLSKNIFRVASDTIVEQNEIKITTFIAEHTIAINVSEHLTELVKSICLSRMEHSQVTKIYCDHTKCTAVINNVIGKTSIENQLIT